MLPLARGRLFFGCISLDILRFIFAASHLVSQDFTTTQPNHMASPPEDWQDLFVVWEEEQADPILFNGAGYSATQGDSLNSNYHLSGSIDAEQPNFLSVTPPFADGLPSLEYTVSAPPSMLDTSTPYGQMYCTSPSFENATTSSLLGYEDARYFGSFDTCDNSLSPLECSQESPILDTRYERIADSILTDGSFDTTSGTLFNPYVVGSSHSFSGLDVRASQMLNLGTWAEQPQIIEPITESDEWHMESTPMPISYPQSQSFDTLTSDQQSENPGLYSRSKAVTIPHSNRRPASHNAAISQPQWAHRVPPMLSVSPIAHRRPRSVALSRSHSRTSSRRGLATSSPSSEGLGWVAYQMNTQTNRLAPTSTEGAPGRAARGRKKALTAEQRSHAALMRIIGACGNCQRRRERCDPGTPCKSCLEHYKGNLINHPCRDRVLSDQSNAFLSGALGWHPTERPLKSFLGTDKFSTLDQNTYIIPLHFGFGPSLAIPVHPLHIVDSQPHLHDHVVYSWPPGSVAGAKHTHAVLPAVLTDNAMENLMQTLDNHLSLLVLQYFRHFPLFSSPLKVLRSVYLYFHTLRPGSSQYRTLHQAFKLLVLVHIGGDITLPAPNGSPVLSQLVHRTMDVPNDLIPTPCFIRSQFGKVMPGLALSMMKEVLSSLEQLLLNRDCDNWPISLAVLIVVLMTIESIHYHAAKVPYHSSYDKPKTANTEEGYDVNDESVKTLLAFYTACFIGCHARLRPDWDGEATTQRTSTAEDSFVESVRESIKEASVDRYLARKATESRHGDDMGYFFDRLVARLLLLKS
jgi:hypothetical protein